MGMYKYVCVGMYEVCMCGYVGSMYVWVCMRPLSKSKHTHTHTNAQRAHKPTRTHTYRLAPSHPLIVVHMHTHTYTCTYKIKDFRTYARACTYTHTHTPAPTHPLFVLHVHTYIHTHIQKTDIHTYALTCAHTRTGPRSRISFFASCIYMYTHACMYTCKSLLFAYRIKDYIYIYIYIHSI